MVNTVLGAINQVRLGFPRYCFAGTGGIGDELMCTTALREWRRRGARGTVIDSHHPALWEHNPEVDGIIFHRSDRWRRWLKEGLPFVRLEYGGYDSAIDMDEAPTEHILKTICRRAGLTGPVELRPYVFLHPREREAGRIGNRLVVFQSSGRAAAHFMENKEWFPERFGVVARALAAQGHTVVQIGSDRDPRLPGAVDLRGKTSLRDSAAILANAQVFVGLVGFLMHLARAVDCRSVIVFGGREKPWQSGYIANRNLTGETACSPCWLRSRCAFDHECMKLITADAVLSATREQIERAGEPMEVESTVI